MVKILANGDIVPDDDPRAQQSSRRQTSQSTAGQGGFQSADRFYQEQGQGHGQQVNIFQALNQRLVAFGIPRWNVGETVIEPIVSVGLLLALLLFGIHGLIFGLILFAVSRWSTHGAPDFVNNIFGGGGDRRDDSSSRGNNRNPGRAGGGYRLGR